MAKYDFGTKRPASVMVLSVCHKTTVCKYTTDHRWDLFASKKKLHVNRNLCATILLTSWWNGVHHGTRQRKRNDDDQQKISHDVKQDAWTSASLKDYDGMVFITWTHRTEKTALNTGTMSGFVTEKTRGWPPTVPIIICQREPLGSWWCGVHHKNHRVRI